MTPNTSSYSSHDIAALESGVQDLVGGEWEHDCILNRRPYNSWSTDVELFMDEELEASGELIFKHDDGSSGIPSTWAAKYLDKTHILNDPVQMFPLLPAWGWPWTNKVVVHFSSKPWSWSPEPVPSPVKKTTVTLTPSPKPLLTVTINAVTGCRSVVVPEPVKGWTRTGGRLSRC